MHSGPQDCAILITPPRLPRLEMVIQSKRQIDDYKISKNALDREYNMLRASYTFSVPIHLDPI
jgi:hypothetical protein